jgi:hypothetical protein
MSFSFPEEIFQAQIEKVLTDILKKRKIEVIIDNIIVWESINSKYSKIECDFKLEGEGTKLVGKGVGPVDALFNVIVTLLKKRYLCLKWVEFEEFRLTAKLSKGRRYSRSDTPVDMLLIIKTNKNRNLYFRTSSTSLLKAAILAVKQAIDFLINCEKAVEFLFIDIECAKQQKRNDLINFYTSQLAELVNVAQFEETITKLKCNHKS